MPTIVVWAGSVQEGDSVVWGTAVAEWAPHIVWGTSIGVVQGSNIIWSTSGGEGDNIVWGTISVGEGDNIVWGTVEYDDIVWGTAAKVLGYVVIGGAL